MHTTNQQHIVIAGSGNLALATYQTLATEWRSAIKKGKVRITIISHNKDYEHSDLLGEIIIGRLEKNAIVCPLESIAKEATIIQGTITFIDRKSHLLEVKLTDGGKQNISYSHLVLETKHAKNKPGADLPGFVQRISTYEETKQLCYQLDKIVRKAASSRSILTARNILRFVLLVQNEKDIALATYISSYLTDSCSRFLHLKDAKPEIFLVEMDASHKVWENSPTINYTNKKLSRLSLRWIKEGILHRFAEDGVVLDNGSFIACSLIIHFDTTSQIMVSCGKSQLEPILDFTTDDFLRLRGESHIWAGYINERGSNDHSSSCNQGKHIARNIILASDCCFLQKYKPAKRGYKGLLFSNVAQVSISGINIANRFAWYLHICYLLWRLPVGIMAKNGLINLVSHFIWKKTKIETGLIHHAVAAPTEIRAAS